MDSYKTKLILSTIMVLMVLENTYTGKYTIITFIIVFYNLCDIYKDY